MAELDKQNWDEMKDTLTEYLEAIEEGYADAIVESRIIRDKLYIHVEKEYLDDIISFIYWELKGFLSSMIGVDERPIDSTYKLYYLLSMEGREADKSVKPWIIVTTSIPWHDTEFPSVTPKVPAASWYEREVHDLLGLKPLEHPDLRRLVVPDDWPEGDYPLRKEFKFDERPPRTEKNYEFKPKVESNKIVQMAMGPLHPMADEPAQFRLFVNGEEIVDVDYRMFYVHRGLEKIAEERFTYNQTSFLAERVCGICGFAHSISYCQAVEDAFNVDVPERALFIRTILLEIERLHSHMLNLGIACHLTGFDWGFTQIFKIRESVMKMAEILTGGRKTYGMAIVGGVRRDILREQADKVIEELRTLRKEFSEIWDVVSTTKTLIDRTEGVGILPAKIARSVSVVGPMARGSGLSRDARKDHPHAAYKHVPFKVQTQNKGDALARFTVRSGEIMESISIVEHALDALQSIGGPIVTENIEPVEYASGVGVDEAPRGENPHFVITGKDSRVYRWRVRAATYNNWPALPYMSRGYTIADFPVIVGSLDPCYSCTERVELVNAETGKTIVVSYSELEKRSIKGSTKPLLDKLR